MVLVLYCSFKNTSSGYLLATKLNLLSYEANYFHDAFFFQSKKSSESKEPDQCESPAPESPLKIKLNEIYTSVSIINILALFLCITLFRLDTLGVGTSSKYCKRYHKIIFLLLIIIFWFQLSKGDLTIDQLTVDDIKDIIGDWQSMRKESQKEREAAIKEILHVKEELRKAVEEKDKIRKEKDK